MPIAKIFMNGHVFGFILFDAERMAGGASVFTILLFVFNHYILFIKSLGG